MSDIVIWIAAGLVVIAVVSLVVVFPFTILPRRAMRPEERGDSAVNAAQDEAEALHRRQPPVA